MIYLVEDDESIRELVIYTLKSQGFEAKGFERPSHFWKALEKEKPALLLLDVMLPEEDGISILKKLRMRPDTRKLPIIMLTAKSSEYDTVVGLDSGADDYIPKPFRMMDEEICKYPYYYKDEDLSVTGKVIYEELNSSGNRATLLIKKRNSSEIYGTTYKAEDYSPLLGKTVSCSGSSDGNRKIAYYNMDTQTMGARDAQHTSFRRSDSYRCMIRSLLDSLFFLRSLQKHIESYSRI